jgi:NAD(P)-dependent dehydrogenase (short-subunit alcohol dehydrogenase family)
VLVGDLSSIAQVQATAAQANVAGPFDAVIHNAAVGYREPRLETADGLEHVFAINVLAPYLLTALIERPRRLVFLSSGMHRRGEADLADLQWRRRPWDGTQAYANSKLLDAVLAFAVARRWPRVWSNAVDPGWVTTRMGGPGATDDMAQAHASVAGRERRSAGDGQRPLLLPPAPPGHPPGRSGCRSPGRPAACLRATHRRGAGGRPRSDVMITSRHRAHSRARSIRSVRVQNRSPVSFSMRVA